MFVKRMNGRSLTLFGILLLLLATGCSTVVTIRSVKPAQYHLGKTPEVALIGVDGDRRDVQDVLVENIVSQSRTGGFFLIADRKGEGIKFEVREGAPVSIGKSVSIKPTEIFIDAKIIDTTVEKDTESRKATRNVTRNGKTVSEEYVQEVKIVTSEAVVAYTVVSKDRVFMEQKEFEGKARLDRDGHEPDNVGMKELAIRESVGFFLKAITPSYVFSRVTMDDSDKNQKEILKEAKKGNLAVTRQQLEDYVKTNPENPAALYNLAVLVDASGEYEAALELYNKALSKGDNKLYVGGKSACMTRINEQKAMEGK